MRHLDMWIDSGENDSYKLLPSYAVKFGEKIEGNLSQRADTRVRSNISVRS